MTSPVVVRTFGEILEEYAAERGSPDLSPVRLGLGELDSEMRGVSAGQVCLIAARTAVGKSFLLASVLDNFAAGRPKEGALTLSLEMPAIEWAERQLAIHEGIAPEEVEKWAQRKEIPDRSRAFLRKTRNLLVCESGLHLTQVGEAIDQARAKLGESVPLRLVGVDYLGLVQGSGNSDYERSSGIARGLKQIAKAKHVALIVAVQLSRSAGDGSEPVSMEMIRDSGAIEEAADFIIGCWRPGKAKALSYEEQSDLEYTLRAKLLKNRKGKDARQLDLAFHTESLKVYAPALAEMEATN
jgi:replicative DNA helicase